MDSKIEGISAFLDGELASSPETKFFFPQYMGVYLSALVSLGRLTQAGNVADWLLSVQGTDGRWTAQQEWDAFNDGSVNPADTSYAVLQVSVVHGLLDLWDATGSAVYRKAGVEGLNFYAPFVTTESPGKWLWYSNGSADAKFVAHSNAMMMSAYAEASVGNPSFPPLAAELWAFLSDQMQASGDRVWWSYRRGSKENDLPHAAMLARGVMRYGLVAGVPVPSAQIIRRLCDYRGKGAALAYPPGVGSGAAPLRGIGIAVAALSEAGHPELAADFMRGLDAYDAPDDLFGAAPGKTDPNVAALSFMLLGLAKFRSIR